MTTILSQTLLPPSRIINNNNPSYKACLSSQLNSTWWCERRQFSSRPCNSLRSPKPVSCTKRTSKGDADARILPSPTKSPSTEDDKSVKVRRMVGLGVSIAVVGMVMMEQSALAFGPEGPIVEEFWDNVRRYLLYFVTVGSGALYAVVEPIIELLRSPVTAVLALLVIFGTVYLVYATVTAMVGLTDFNYQYAL